MEFKIFDYISEFETVAEKQYKSFQPNINRRKYSYVWKFFRAIKGTKLFECIICNHCVGKQTSNLSRHLAVAHDITKQSEGIESKHRNRGRASRSFIWKYCTKENIKYARCHLCNKLLYFGGGNTGNISKHLRRKHFNILQTNEDIMDETTQAISSIDTIEIDNGNEEVDLEKDIKYSDIVLEAPTRKERKGSSYVWNYCDKLSRNTIRCKLCSKVMSFHGTANVITHLQRKHNILGKLDESAAAAENTQVDLIITEDTSNSPIEKADKEERRNRRSSGTMSVVWKYCTRIDKDLVRCGFCNKNLSYQGTSNLQRHLHRMHGVATQSRFFRPSDPNDGYEVKMLSSDIIWEHCVMLENEKIKCNMCNCVFDSKNMEAISRHLIFTHSVMPPKRHHSEKSMKRAHSGDDSSEDYDNYDNDNWGNGHKYEEVGDSSTPHFEENIIKKNDVFLYDDIIEEEHEQTNYVEDPFNPQEEVIIENPLSPQTSLDNSPERRVTLDTKRLEKLKEELVRMETEYYKEKAGFYRMQTYLSALQAKKIRLEFDRIDNATTTYTMDIENIQQ